MREINGKLCLQSGSLMPINPFIAINIQQCLLKNIIIIKLSGNVFLNILFVLYFCRTENRVQCLLLLLSKSGNSVVHLRDSKGRTPLHIAGKASSHFVFVTIKPLQLTLGQSKSRAMVEVASIFSKIAFFPLKSPNSNFLLWKFSLPSSYRQY